ncbi:MAG TPA: hypothetical protein VFN96_08035 [Gemmatimonadales bacterium]|nr:hypothetical protein [Gemmatimonadales bacterium]
MGRGRYLLTARCALAALPTLAAQAPARDSLLADGIRLADREPGEAARRFEALAGQDSLDAEARWRAAIALNDAATLLDPKADRGRRDSLYARALKHGRRALALDSAGVWPAFALGVVLGNVALTRGLKERVRMAVEIRELALRAIAADSTHDGAHHLLGRWHAEVRRLSGLKRMVAKSILGAGAFGKASWAEARAHLERAVALDPARIFHHLDLGKICLDLGDLACAAAALRSAGELPARYAIDPEYQREAAGLLARIESGRRD